MVICNNVKTVAKQERTNEVVNLDFGKFPWILPACFVTQVRLNRIAIKVVEQKVVWVINPECMLRFFFKWK